MCFYAIFNLLNCVKTLSKKEVAKCYFNEYFTFSIVLHLQQTVMGARCIIICGTVTGLFIGLGLIVGPTLLMLTNYDVDTSIDGLHHTHILGKPDLNHLKIHFALFINVIRINIIKILLYLCFSC